jgi:hypothetical protein
MERPDEHRPNRQPDQCLTTTRRRTNRQTAARAESELGERVKTVAIG